MHWKLKGVIQNLVDMLPPRVSYACHYYLQRRFGGLRSVDSMNPLEKSVKIVQSLRRHGHDVLGKTCIEIGTGHAVNVPMGLWLCGAGRIITVDLNLYLKEEIVVESVDYVREHKEEMERMFQGVADTTEVNRKLTLLLATDRRLDALLDLMRIEYLAPADASSLGHIRDGSADIHYSSKVLEHIPPDTIQSILLEAKRVLRSDGVVAHRIDLHDHFAKGDAAITSANFLQFSEKQWARWGGNRFAYHNRLRAYEFYELFDAVGLELLSAEEVVDSRALERLANGLCLDDRFSGHSFRELAVESLNIVGAFGKMTGADTKTERIETVI